MSAPRCGTLRPRSTGPPGTVPVGARVAAGPPAARVAAPVAAAAATPTSPRSEPGRTWPRADTALGQHHLAGERRAPGVRRAAAAFLDPARYGVGIGPGHAAQPSRGPGQRLVRLALARALEDAGHLGQQVGPALRQPPDFGQRGRLLVLRERAPLGAMARLAGQLSHQDPVGLRPRSLIPHSYSVADLQR